MISASSFPWPLSVSDPWSAHEAKLQSFKTCFANRLCLGQTTGRQLPRLWVRSDDYDARLDHICSSKHFGVKNHLEL